MIVTQKLQQGNIIQRDNTRVAPSVKPLLKKKEPLPNNSQSYLSSKPKQSEYFDKQSRINATKREVAGNLEKSKHNNFWTQPYSDFTGEQAYGLATNLIKETAYAGAGEALGSLLLGATNKLVTSLMKPTSKTSPKLAFTTSIKTRKLPNGSQQEGIRIQSGKRDYIDLFEDIDNPEGLFIDYVNSESGIGTELYKEALRYAQKTGKRGLVSGKNVIPESQQAISKITKKFKSEPLDRGSLLTESKDRVGGIAIVETGTTREAQNIALKQAKTEYYNTMFPEGKVHPDMAKRAKNIGWELETVPNEGKLGLIDRGNPKTFYGDRFSQAKRRQFLKRNTVANTNESGDIVMSRVDPKTGNTLSPEDVKSSTWHELLHRTQIKNGVTLDKKGAKYFEADVANPIARKLKPYMRNDEDWLKSADEIWADLHAYRMNKKIGARDLTDNEAAEAIAELTNHWDFSKFSESAISKISKALKALPSAVGVYPFIPRNNEN